MQSLTLYYYSSHYSPYGSIIMQVTCRSCIKQKAYLPYMQKEHEVCVPCYIESKKQGKISKIVNFQLDTLSS